MTNLGPTFEGAVAGPISEPDHLAELVEYHEISVPVPPGRFSEGWGCASANQLREAAREKVWAVCHSRAREWLNAHGLDAKVVTFEETGASAHVDYHVNYLGYDAPAPELTEVRWGVRWLIKVGRCVDAAGKTSKGREQHEIDAIGGQPQWVWSDRWQMWAEVFDHLRRDPAAGLAEVEALAEAIIAGDVITIDDARHRRRSDVVRGHGIRHSPDGRTGDVIDLPAQTLTVVDHPFNDARGLGICVQPLDPPAQPGEVQTVCGLTRGEHEARS